jgi:hypothetical protein
MAKTTHLTAVGSQPILNHAHSFVRTDVFHGEPHQPIGDDLLRQLLVGYTVRDIDHGRQYCLSCGVVVNFYATGTVMVQGKLHPAVRDSVLSALKQILPANTRWQAR